MGRHVRVLEIATAADALERSAREVPVTAFVVLVLEVVEPVPPDVEAEIPPRQRELPRPADLVRYEANVVVEGAVVAVHRRERSTVSDADQALVPLLRSDTEAVSEREVDEPVHIADGEDLRTGRRRERGR